MHSTALSIVSIVTLNLVVAGGMADEPRCRLFHARADHGWNELHAAIWLRTTGHGKILGRDRIDPLLWPDTRYLTSGPSLRRAVSKVDRFLATTDEALSKDLLKRAILQRDLWAVFDWLANRELNEKGLSLEPSDRSLRRRLRSKLVAAIKRLALDRQQIAGLSNNYTAAVQSRQFPPDAGLGNSKPFLPSDLFDRKGPWVGLGTSDGPITPAHIRGRSGFSRSAFSVFLRLPGGRDQTISYLMQLATFPTPWVRDKETKAFVRMVPNPATPQFPRGTQVALVRHMMLIDSKGRLTPTPIVEQLQFRVFHKLEPVAVGKSKGTPPQAFFEFVLDRRRLFANKAGGLRAIEPTEKDFFPVPFSHAIDPIADSDRRKADATRRQAVVLRSCAGCHRGPGVLSVNVYTRAFGPRGLQTPSFFVTGPERGRQMAVLEKHRRYEWGMFSGLWHLPQNVASHSAGTAAREAAIAAIAKCGGTTRFDQKTMQATSVFLEGQSITNRTLSHLSALTKLTSVKLYGTAANGGLEHLQSLRELRALSLEASAFADDGLKPLRAMTQLERLDLTRTKISDRGLKHLRGLNRLKSLRLRSTAVSDEGMQQIQGLKQLTQLELGRTKITDAGLEHVKGLGELKTLSIYDTSITDAALEHFRGLKRLRFLMLKRTDVTPQGVKRLQKVLPECFISHSPRT